MPSGVPILSTGPERPPISGRGSTSATDAQRRESGSLRHYHRKKKPMKVVSILENPGKNIVVNVTTGGYQPYAFSSN
jgi:hypothetical protein